MSRVKEQLSRVKRVTHDLLKRVFWWKRQAAAAAAAATERNEHMSRVKEQMTKDTRPIRLTTKPIVPIQIKVVEG